MTTLENFLHNEAGNMDSMIYSLYEKFKDFICCDTLPNFIIQYVDSREDTTIYFRALVTVFHNPIIMFYNIDNCNEDDETFEADLIHEFTHIYDYHMQSKIYNNQFIKNNFSMYSEYHAVQIEILYRCRIVSKFTDLIDFTKMDLSKLLKIVSWKIAMYMTLHKEYTANMSEHKFYLLKKAYFYINGAISIAKEISNNNINLKVMDFISPHNNIMQKGTKLLWSTKYTETPSKEILEEIGKINTSVIF